MSWYEKSLSVSEMPLINGRFDLWPDATSQTSAGFLGAMHKVSSLGTSGAATVNQQSFTMGQTAVPGEPVYFLRWAQGTAATAGTPELRTKIEDVRTFAGQKVMVQGWYRANQAFDVKLMQNFGSGGSPSTAVTTGADLPSSTLPVTTDSSGVAQWRPFSMFYTLPSLASKTIGTTANTSYLAIRYLWPLNTTFQVDLADVLIHKGGERIPSDRRRPIYEEERLLERYYVSTTAYAPVSTQSSNWVPFRRRMAGVPTMAGGTGSTLGTATVDGFPIVSSGAAAAITAITADARIAD